MISSEMRMMNRREVTLEMRVMKAQSRLGNGGDLMKYVFNGVRIHHSNESELC